MIPNTQESGERQPGAEAAEHLLGLNKETLRDLDVEDAGGPRAGAFPSITCTITTVTITATTWKETKVG